MQEQDDDEGLCFQLCLTVSSDSQDDPVAGVTLPIWADSQPPVSSGGGQRTAGETDLVVVVVENTLSDLHCNI